MITECPKCSGGLVVRTCANCMIETFVVAEGSDRTECLWCMCSLPEQKIRMSEQLRFAKELERRRSLEPQLDS